MHVFAARRTTPFIVGWIAEILTVYCRADICTHTEYTYSLQYAYTYIVCDG